MPIAPIIVACEHTPTWKTWKLSQHLACGVSLAYVFDADDVFHAYDPVLDTYLVTFPNLIKYKLTPDGVITDWDRLIEDLGDDAITKMTAAAGGRGWHTDTWIRATILAGGNEALTKYTTRGAGRSDSVLCVRHMGQTQETMKRLVAWSVARLITATPRET